MSGRLTGLDGAQQQELITHIATSDFPETEAGFDELVRGLGAEVEPRFSAEDGFHHVVVITR